MRTQIAVFITYLLLACILLEDALPYIAKSNMMEMCESKKENSEKEKEFKDELKEVKERFQSTHFRIIYFLLHPQGLLGDSEKIPDSAHRSIFSPPPNRV